MTTMNENNTLAKMRYLNGCISVPVNQFEFIEDQFKASQIESYQ